MIKLSLKDDTQEHNVVSVLLLLLACQSPDARSAGSGQTLGQYCLIKLSLKQAQ